LFEIDGTHSQILAYEIATRMQTFPVKKKDNGVRPVGGGECL